ncbi:MAG: lysoplasmalogenase [Bdellovibrionales bacterium]|nr:lysoplasmalogenase [Bdellovibrionales bacterium]
MSSIILLSIAAFILMIVFIVYSYKSIHSVRYVSKPAIMICIILIPFLRDDLSNSSYRNYIVLGLIFSLIGDIFLVFKEQKLMAGLFSFLVAHLIYIYSFFNLIQFELRYWPLFILVPFSIFIYLFIADGLGEMKIPVIIYVGAIMGMVWGASSVAIVNYNLQSFLVFIGAVLFLISDTALSISLFKTSYSSSKLIVAGTYFPAQYLIAISVII